MSDRKDEKVLCEFLIASCENDGGVYRYILDKDGGIHEEGKISAPSPMFLGLDGDKLWAVLNAPFGESSESGIVSYDLRRGVQTSPIVTTLGAVGCHIAVSEGDVYCANYVSGSVYKAPDVIRVHSGHSINEKRQSSPHAHSVFLSPSGRYLLTCDLGLDKIIVYDRDLNKISEASVPAGEGVRHAVFSKYGDYLYAVNEMGGSISIFSWCEPSLTYINTVSILPDGHEGIGSGAAIKLSEDGEYLYATERASGSIVTLRVENDRLTVISHTDCRGREPRDFSLLANGKYAVCTNQKSHNIVLFRIVNRVPEYLNSYDLPSPLCAIELPHLPRESGNAT